MLRASACRGWLGVVLVLAAAGWCRAQPPFVPVDPVPTAMESRILGALETVTDVEFTETPLNRVAQYVSDLHQFPVLIDDDALDAAGVRSDATVTLTTHGIRLRSVLRLMLDKLHLTYSVHDEVLMITTPAGAAKKATTKVYDVSKILDLGDTADDLARTLEATLAARQLPASESEPAVMTPDQVLAVLHTTEAASASRRISAYGQMLLVRDTTSGHEQVDELLRALQASVVRRAAELQRAQEGALRTLNPMPETPPEEPAPDQPKNEPPKVEPPPKTT